MIMRILAITPCFRRSSLFVAASNHRFVCRSVPPRARALCQEEKKKEEERAGTPAIGGAAKRRSARFCEWIVLLARAGRYCWYDHGWKGRGLVLVRLRPRPGLGLGLAGSGWHHTAPPRHNLPPIPQPPRT